MFSAHGVAPSVHANAARRAAADDRRHLPAGDQGPRRGEEVRRRGLHDRADRPRRPRGGRGHDGRGARAHRADRGRGRRRRRSRSTTREGRLHLPDDAVGRRDARRSSTACASGSRRSSGPRTDDICYATTNRQAAVKQLARQADLVLVIGSRNSSNSNRLVEVAREHGAESHLIDNELQVREEWLEGKRVVGITSGASAPEELVQRLVEFFRDRGTEDVRELEVVQEDVRFMLPKAIRQAHGRRRRLTARGALRTLVVSDLHLGAHSGRDVLRSADALAALLEAVAECDRLVLLGDLLELRHGPQCATRWRRRDRPLAELGAALGRRRGRDRPRQPRPPAAARRGSSAARPTRRRHRSGSRPRSTGTPGEPLGARRGVAGARRTCASATRACGCATTSTRPTATTATCTLTVPTLERLGAGVDGAGRSREPVSRPATRRGLRGDAGADLRLDPRAWPRRGRPERGGRLHGGSVRGWRGADGLRRRPRPCAGRAIGGGLPGCWSRRSTGPGSGRCAPDLSGAALRRAGLRAIERGASRGWASTAAYVDLRPHPSRRPAARRRPGRVAHARRRAS